MSDADSPHPAETLDGVSTVEVRTSASAALIPTIRAVASDLAARADFDLDAISDLRCTFLVRADGIEVLARVHAGPEVGVSTDTFGWRVLQTLADEVAVIGPSADDGAAATVGIRLDKLAGEPSR